MTLGCQPMCTPPSGVCLNRLDSTGLDHLGVLGEFRWQRLLHGLGPERKHVAAHACERRKNVASVLVTPFLGYRDFLLRRGSPL